MARMHSTYYHANSTNGWDKQPVLPLQMTRMHSQSSISTLVIDEMHSQYYYINNTNDLDAQPVLPISTS